MAEDLRDVLSTVAARIKQNGPKALNEENTKASLIGPVLRAIGWDPEDLGQVYREYKPKSHDKPVDYALMILDKPRLFIEAKALGANLDDPKWANQILGYASVAGVVWVVLTNGDEYRIYNSHAAVPVEKKIFRSVRGTDNDEILIQTLKLLSREEMQRDEIDALWAAYSIDGKIREAIEQLFGPEPDPSLVSLILKRTKLSPSDVKSGLRRIRVRLEAPEPPAIVSNEQGVSVPAVTKNGHSHGHTGISLSALIQADLVRPPFQLETKYKGRTLYATIQGDGRVKFDETTYSSLSAAGGAARRTVVGDRNGQKYPATNGWTFWHYKDSHGISRPITALRQRYAEGKGLQVQLGDSDAGRQAVGAVST